MKAVPQHQIGLPGGAGNLCRAAPITNSELEIDSHPNVNRLSGGTVSVRQHERCHFDLSRVERGDPKAAQQLLALVYDELRRLAASKWPSKIPARRSTQRHWYTKRGLDWWVLRIPRFNDRTHFFRAAAEGDAPHSHDRARRGNKHNVMAGAINAWTSPDSI